MHICLLGLDLLSTSRQMCIKLPIQANTEL